MKEREFIGQRPRQGISREESQLLVGPSQRFLVQRRMQTEERKEAAVPLCDQRWRGGLVNRTIVLLKSYSSIQVVLTLDFGPDWTV